MIRFPRLLPAGLLLLSLAALPGCDDPIRTYDVPYVEQRLLGAFVFTQDALWAFKMMGKSDDVAAQKKEFEQFIKSLRFQADAKKPITWSLPQRWEHEAGKGMRFATFRLPGNLELTVFRFEGRGGDLLANVNRWREQLKLDPINGEQLLKICEREKLAGDIEAFTVDMKGARFATLREPMPADPANTPFDFKAPAGWVANADPGAMAVATFTIAKEGQKAEVTLTPLRGGGGSISANINRWRGQLGLPEASEEQMRKDSKVIKVDGKDSILVELIGPKGKSIRAAICPGGEATWFVKMMGDGELVAKQKDAFDEFLASLKFRGEKKDE